MFIGAFSEFANDYFKYLDRKVGFSNNFQTLLAAIWMNNFCKIHF